MKTYIITSLVVLAIVASLFLISKSNYNRVKTMLEEQGFVTEDNEHYNKNSVTCVLDHSYIVCSDEYMDHIGWSSISAVDDSWVESLMKAVEA